MWWPACAWRSALPCYCSARNMLCVQLARLGGALGTESPHGCVWAWRNAAQHGGREPLLALLKESVVCKCVKVNESAVNQTSSKTSARSHQQGARSSAGCSPTALALHCHSQAASWASCACLRTSVRGGSSTGLKQPANVSVPLLSPKQLANWRTHHARAIGSAHPLAGRDGCAV